MRVSEYLRERFLEASREVFGESPLVLFGSRVDDKKRGGDFDLAVMGVISDEAFRRGKVRFFKKLLLEDLDLPSTSSSTGRPTIA